MKSEQRHITVPQQCTGPKRTLTCRTEVTTSFIHPKQHSMMQERFIESSVCSKKCSWNWIDTFYALIKKKIPSKEPLNGESFQDQQAIYRELVTHHLQDVYPYELTSADSLNADIKWGNIADEQFFLYTTETLNIFHDFVGLLKILSMSQMRYHYSY